MSSKQPTRFSSARKLFTALFPNSLKTPFPRALATSKSDPFVNLHCKGKITPKLRPLRHRRKSTSSHKTAPTLTKSPGPPCEEPYSRSYIKRRSSLVQLNIVQSTFSLNNEENSVRQGAATPTGKLIPSEAAIISCERADCTVNPMFQLENRTELRPGKAKMLRAIHNSVGSTMAESQEDLAAIEPQAKTDEPFRRIQKMLLGLSMPENQNEVTFGRVESAVNIFI